MGNCCSNSNEISDPVGELVTTTQLVRIVIRIIWLEVTIQNFTHITIVLFICWIDLRVFLCLDKEHVFQKVERELRVKLHEVEDSNQHKSSLLRRVEELNSEVKHLQAGKSNKDQKLKHQVRRNEELQSDMEKINF